jgi:ubiquinone biosynthesis protein Coq4
MNRLHGSFQVLKQLGKLIAVGKSSGNLEKIADLVDSFLDTPQMNACITRFRELPGGSEMMDERYPPLQPDLDSLAQYPAGSLGHEYAALIRKLNYDPEFFRPRLIDTEGRWLTQRIATTHDIHHLISGFNTEREGENGVLAITASQISFPAYVCLNQAVQTSNFRFRLKSYPAISKAINHGITIGFTSQAFCTARWEDHWDWSIEQWRHHLQIQYPADHCSYGLNPSL